MEKDKSYILLKFGRAKKGYYFNLKDSYNFPILEEWARYWESNKEDFENKQAIKLLTEIKRQKIKIDLILDFYGKKVNFTQAIKYLQNKMTDEQINKLKAW